MTIRRGAKQRADYTHKFNARNGRHGWLRLTPAYSVKLVEEIMAEYDNSKSLHVFDPFCGTATTALSAVNRGHSATTIDINPFLVWLGRAKTRFYPQRTLRQACEAADFVLECIRTKCASPTDAPPIHMIGRWWSPPAVDFLCLARGAINQSAAQASPERDLLDIVFCRTLIALSNAAFNHQSMSFRKSSQYSSDIIQSGAKLFAENATFVIQGARDNPKGNCSVVNGDSRVLSSEMGKQFDLIITSPPYANRMSYIRELRPYMYWLGYLRSGRDAAEIDWQSIGGTWGTATGRLSKWRPVKRAFRPNALRVALKRIADERNPNGALLANYVKKYFEDMASHFRNARALLSKDAKVHYVDGNSMYYGVLVPTEKIYAELMRYFGFIDINVHVLRKRNSKKGLVEFDVSAAWPGGGGQI